MKEDKRLRELFSESPELPEELSRESMKKKLKQSAHKTARKRGSYIVESLAAAFAVIIIAALMLTVPMLERQGSTVEGTTASTGSSEQVIPPASDKQSLPEELHRFESREQIEEYFEQLTFVDDVYLYAAAGDLIDIAPPAASADEVKTEAVAGSQNSLLDSFTGTNTQHTEVDEGDVIKNDGRYIYILSRIQNSCFIKILDIEDMRLLSTLSYCSDEETSIAPVEIYISGDTLVLIYQQWELPGGNNSYSYYHYYNRCETHIDIYDISNRERPVRQRTLEQEGGIVASRLVNDVLYLVSAYSVSADEQGKAENIVPSVNGKEIPCDCIVYFDDSSTHYSVITATDIKDKYKKQGLMSVLGSTQEIYCSDSNMYLLKADYSDSLEKTSITRLSLQGTEISCTAQCEVEGRYDDKYSFDEHEGMLRVVTTRYDPKKYIHLCTLYVFDSELEQIGIIEDITDGLDEQVKSVRFMGDMAYVVTFMQTDPLFIIDLGNPAEPKVTGELFMPGYSSYLHPLGNGLLLGIGYAGDEENADFSKLKLALFDISDSVNPRLIDEFVIKNADTDVNYEPKALIHYPEKQLVGIPVTVYAGKGDIKSFAVISYKDNTIDSVEGFLHDNGLENRWSELFRGTCIGDCLYTIDNYMVAEHSLESGELLRKTELMSSSELEQVQNQQEKYIYSNSIIF